MCALWCHSSGRRRPRRLARNTFLPSQIVSTLAFCAMRPTRTPPVRGSARSWISCRRGGPGGSPPPPDSYTWSYFRKLLILWAGRWGGVEARLLHISCCRRSRRWSRCTEAVGPARIHASAGHHESTEPEVCSSGSTSGAICVWRAGLQNWWR